MKKFLFGFLSILVSTYSFSQSIVSVNPSTVNAGQTLNVTITGNNTHFNQGSGTYIYFKTQFGQGSSSITANYTNVINENQIIANITVPANHVNSYVDVSMYDYSKGVFFGKENAMFVNAPNSPQVISVSPTTVDAGQTLDVTIIGKNTNFLQGSATNAYFTSPFNQGSSSVITNSFNPINDTSLIVNVTVPANHSHEFVDLSMFDYFIDCNYGKADVIFINAPNNPQIKNVNPSSINAGETLDVTITGANTYFTQGSGTWVNFSTHFGQGSSSVLANSYNTINDTTMVINISVPFNQPSEYVDISITDYINNFYYGKEDALFINPTVPPTLVSVSPSSGNNGETLNVTITGSNTHFTQGSNTSLGFWFNQGSGTTPIVNSYTIINDTSISANVFIPSNTYTGNFGITVYSSPLDGYLNLNNAFHVNGVTPPSLISIAPSSANIGETLNVTITGSHTHFTQGSGTNINFEFNQGSGTTVVNSYTILNDSSITANITIPTNIYTGDYDVYVFSNPDGYLTLKNAFHINGNTPPSLVAISPSNVIAGQTLNVTITGTKTHFTQGSNTYIDFEFGQGSGTSVVNNYSIVNDSTISANITIPSNLYTGTYDVYAYNIYDGYMTLQDGLHITGAACNITAGFSFTDNGNGNYTFTNASTGNIVLQNWNFGDGYKSTLSNPSHNYVANGTYAVVLTVTDSITSNSVCYNYTAKAVVVTGVTNPVPCNAAYAIFKDTISNTVMVLNSSTGNNLSYFWDFGDGNFSTQPFPDYTYSSNGPFNLCLSVNNGNGCISTYCDSIGLNGIVFRQYGFSISVKTPAFVGVNELETKVSALNIYPNPVINSLTIDITLIEQSQVEIILTDLLGNIVSTIENKTLNSGNNLIQLNTSDLTSGLYLINVKTNNYYSVKKLIISK